MKPKDELIVGPVVDRDGTPARPYIRVTPEGEISRGILGEGLPNPKGEVELNHLGGSRFAVTKVTRFTESGPAQVASPQYRDGWSRIFGGKAPVGQA
jgi:hypothetical protein